MNLEILDADLAISDHIESCLGIEVESAICILPEELPALVSHVHQH